MTQRQERLFVLEASGGGRLFCVHPDGSGKTVLVTGCRVPDGVAVDVAAGHVYWTNMGVPEENDGSIERAERRHAHPEAAPLRGRGPEAVLG